MPEGSIDKLSIEITSTAGSATKNLDALANALENLTTKTGGTVARLEQIAASVTQLKNAASGLNLSAFERLSTFKLSKASVTNLTNLANVVRTFPTAGTSQIRNLGEAFMSLSNLATLRLGPAINQLKKLPDVFREYQSFNISGLVNQLTVLNTELDHLAVNVNALAYAFKKMPASMRTAGAAARSVAASNKYLSTTTNTATKSLTSMIAKIGGLSGLFYMVTRSIGTCINEANTYIENMNLFNASMGEYASQAYEYAQVVQNAMGIDAGEWARNQGIFQTLATGMGETTDRAAIMSQQLTQLGYDIASFYNIRVDDAMLKLQSGLSGELEPLRRLGWDLSNARMQMELTSRGIDKNVSSMTQAEKVALRYYLIMNQVTQVHGDMARTIASPANQLRILQAQITLTARAIGDLLIPALNLILPYVIAAVKAIRMFAQELANFFGIDVDFKVDYSQLDTSGFNTGAEDVEDFGDEVEDTTDKVDKLKNSILGFDELNVLNPLPTDTNTNLDELESPDLDIEDLFPLDTYDFLGDLSDEIARKSDELAQKMYDAFKKLLPLLAAIGAALAAWKLGKALLKGLADLLDNLGRICKHIDTINKKQIKPKVVQPSPVAIKVIEPPPTVVKALPPGPVRIPVIVDMNPIDKLRGILKNTGTIVTDKIGTLPAIFTKAIAPLGVVAGSFAIMYNQSSNFKAGWDDLMSKLANFDWSFLTIEIDWDAIFTEIQNWMNKIGEWWAPIGQGIIDIFTDVWEKLGNIGQSIVDWFASLGIDITPITDAIAKAFGIIGDTVSQIGEGIGFVVGTTANVVGEWFTKIQEIFQFNLGDVLLAAGTAISAAMGNIPGAVIMGTGWVISLGIRAYGWGIQDCITEVEVLGDVSEDTKERFGTSMDDMEGAIKKITELDFANAVITEEDVANITTKVQGVKDTILNNLDAERNEELAAMDPIKNLFTDEEYQGMIDSINGFYDNMATTIEEKAGRIGEIYANASAEHRALTEEEQQEVNRITDEMCNQLVETSGANEEDLKTIREAIANNDERYALEAASKVITAAKDERDQVVENANSMEADAKEALHRYAEEHGWTADQISEKEAVIEQTYQSMRDAAEQSFDEIVSNTEASLGELSTKIDTETGEILNNWQAFWQDMKTAQSNAEQAMKYTKEENLVFHSQSQSSGSGMSYGGLNLESLKDTDVFNLEWLTTPHGNDAYLEEQKKKKRKGYASGGLPTSGEIFLARENGVPEYIGSFGGQQNAVANNEQIISGIQQGVTLAMLNVLSTQHGNEREQNIEIPIYLDRVELARGVYRGNLDLVRRGEITANYV